MSDTLFPMPKPTTPEPAITRYVPRDWADEVIPAPQHDPGNFLYHKGDHWYLVEVGARFHEANFFMGPVKHGDLIEFESYRHYGSRIITVAADESYSLSEPFPQDANWFVFDELDNDSGMNTLAEVIRVNRENDPQDFTPPYEATISGMFAGETTTFRVVIENAAEGESARLEKLPEPPLVITYTNWRGETAIRRIRPLGIKFTASLWHKDKQWILEAYDYDREAMRGFALKDFGQSSPTMFKLQWECSKQDMLYLARAPLFGSIRVERYILSDPFNVDWSVAGFRNTLLPGDFRTAEDAMKAVDDHVARILFPETSNG